ncbi:MAG: CPBP family intramembrane glutamic endopeptidase [Nonlabens sp.]|uniref:CPBP family intramembrane glutamic endopeptidase n=1 Tax=Nonlabens sp. TaxID=1888209 RepID=UPI003EF15949
MVHDILNYFKNPDAEKGPNIFNTQKVKLFWTSFWMIMVCNIGLSILIYGVEALGWVSTDNHAVMDMVKEQSVLFILVAAVIAAPLLEELIFRAPITLFRSVDRSDFRWIFYLFALLFGAVHITNYGISMNTILLLPILTAPQIVAGLFLGLIRVKVGLLYSMLFHAIYNGVLMIPSIIYLKYFEM